MGSSFGRLFRLTTFGESHGGALGCIVEGCPPGLDVDIEAIQRDLERRRPGQSDLVSPRREPDQLEILSGLFEGRTLGSPIAMIVKNRDADPAVYAPFRDLYRPSHADYTTDARYGERNWQGGGRASARETVGRVAGGALARQVLRRAAGIEVQAWVDQVGDIRAGLDSARVSSPDVEASKVRCPDPELSAAMEARIREVRKEGDSIGGVVRAVAHGVPAGLGDPVFDKLEADLAKAMLSLPAAKGFESGLGYGSLGTVVGGVVDLVEQPVEAVALDELHDEEVAIVDGPGLIDLDDGVVIEAGHDLALALEAHERAVVVLEVVVEDLDRDRDVQVRMNRAEDRPGGAATELFMKLIAAEGVALGRMLGRAGGRSAAADAGDRGAEAAARAAAEHVSRERGQRLAVADSTGAARR